MFSVTINKNVFYPRLVVPALLVILFATPPFSRFHTLYAASPIARSRQAASFLEKGKYKESIGLFRSALQDNPNYQPALIGLADAYNAIGAHRKAMILLIRAKSLRSKPALVSSKIGYTHLYLGEVKKAMDAFLLSRKIEPGYLDAELGIAIIFRMRGLYNQAFNKLATLERRAPMYTRIYLERFRTALSMNNYPLAKKALERAKIIDPNNGHIYEYQAALALHRYMQKESSNQSDLEEPLRNVKIALDLGGKNIDTLALLNQIYFLKKDWQESQKALDEILSFNPDYYLFYYLAGFSAEQLGRKEKALAYYSQSIDKNSNNSVVRAHIENFLLANNIAIEHPLRRRLARFRLSNASYFFKRNLSERAYHELRRAEKLDPYGREVLQMLLGHYRLSNAFSLYIKELKTILKNLHPAEKKLRQQYQFELEKSLRRRRQKLFYREGFSYPFSREPIRIHVQNAKVKLLNRMHPNLGKVFYQMLGFDLTVDDKFSLAKDADFVLSTEIEEDHERILARFHLKQSFTGISMSRFTLEESGRGALDRISQRAARRIRERIPGIGSIIKLSSDYVIINLGKFDGLSEKHKVAFYRKSRRQFLSDVDAQLSQIRYVGNIVELDDFIAKIVLAERIPTIQLNRNDIAVPFIPKDTEKKADDK